jgi:nicotinate-nucleotide pyrophosphorylase (carboxylating)
MNNAPDARAVENLVRAALAEDIGPGDATSLALVPAEARATAHLVAKAPGVLAGLACFTAAFRALDPDCTITLKAADGARVAPGERIARLDGRARALLSAERTALNFLGRLSGIASAARRLADAAGPDLAILDTRKTTPGLRLLEKYAVACGGGRNHRFGLYDMILVKENHIRACGGIAVAVSRARAAYPDLKVEVEATTLNEVEAVIKSGADRVMFDNMDDAMIADAVALVAGRLETEASGNMDEARITRLAGSGLDYISVGALTHSVTCLDLSLLFDN